MYGNETWVMAEKDRKLLGTWDTKILRRTYGPVVEQGIWRIRTDQGLRKLYKDVDIVADIKKKSLEWVGHVARMDQGRTVKKIFESNWREVGEEDLVWDGWKIWRRI